VRTWQQLIEPAFEDELLTCPAATLKTKLTISPDNRYVVVGSYNGAVVVLDIKAPGSGFEIGDINEE